MKNKLVLAIVFTFAITTLLFAGCSNGGRKNIMKGGNGLQQTSNSPAATNNGILKKDAKNITDNDLLSSDKEDSSVQLDSLDDQSQQLSSDEIDSLLNANSTLNNIPSNFSTK